MAARGVTYEIDVEARIVVLYENGVSLAGNPDLPWSPRDFLTVEKFQDYYLRWAAECGADADHYTALAIAKDELIDRGLIRGTADHES